jgi:MFS family permease
MASTMEGKHDQEQSEEEKLQDARNEAIAPDGGWGWVVVFGSFIVYFIADGCVYSFGVFYNELLDYFGESKGKTAIIPAMLYGFPLLLSPFICALVNSFGCRKIGMMGGVLIGLGFLISNFGTSVEFLILSLGGCCSIGLQMSYIAAIMTVTYYFDARRGLATGLAVAGSGIGTFTFAPIFEALIRTYAWRGAALILAGICFNIITASCLFRPIATEPCYKNSQETGDEGIEEKGQAPTADSAKDIKENIPMVHLQKPDDGNETDEVAKMMVISDSKIVLLSRAGSECEKMSQISGQSVAGTSESVSKDSNLTLESENCPEGSDTLKKDDSLLLTAPQLRPVGKVVSKSAELLNVPGCALDRKLSHSDQRLHNRKDSSGRCCSLQEVRYHRGGSPIIFTSYTSLRNIIPDTSRTPNDRDTNVTGQRGSAFLFELKQAMINMFDVTLIRQPEFLLLCVSNFMLCLWFGAPYIYIVDKASLYGIEQFHASFLISIIGITSTIGQVMLGFIGDKFRNCIFIYEVSMVLCGISTLLIPSCISYWSHCLAVAVFGFFISANYSLTTLILIQVVGLEKLTTAFGFLQLGQGIGTILGTPLVGMYGSGPNCSKQN